MFEKLKRRKTIKMFLEDIECIRAFLKEDMRLEVVDDCFSYHVMKNMNVKMLNSGKKFYVFSNDVPEALNEYLDKVEKFLNDTSMDVSGIKESIMENRV